MYSLYFVHLRIKESHGIAVFSSTWLSLIGQQRRPVASGGCCVSRSFIDNTENPIWSSPLSGIHAGTLRTTQTCMCNSYFQGANFYDKRKTALLVTRSWCFYLPKQWPNERLVNFWFRFFFFKNSTHSSSKPGTYITHNAMEPATDWLKSWCVMLVTANVASSSAFFS